MFLLFLKMWQNAVTSNDRRQWNVTWNEKFFKCWSPLLLGIPLKCQKKCRPCNVQPDVNDEVEDLRRSSVSCLNCLLFDSSFLIWQTGLILQFSDLSSQVSRGKKTETETREKTTWLRSEGPATPRKWRHYNLLSSSAQSFPSNPQGGESGGANAWPFVPSGQRGSAMLLVNTYEGQQEVKDLQGHGRLVRSPGTRAGWGWE